jgi:phosphomannomutase/phosphoglucomutase
LPPDGNRGALRPAALGPTRRTVTTPEIRFDCPDDLKFEVVRRCTAELRAGHKTIEVDGVRVLFPQAGA